MLAISYVLRLSLWFSGVCLCHYDVFLKVVFNIFLKTILWHKILKIVLCEYPEWLNDRMITDLLYRLPEKCYFQLQTSSTPRPLKLGKMASMDSFSVRMPINTQTFPVREATCLYFHQIYGFFFSKSLYIFLIVVEQCLYCRKKVVWSSYDKISLGDKPL